MKSITIDDIDLDLPFEADDYVPHKVKRVGDKFVASFAVHDDSCSNAIMAWRGYEVADEADLRDLVTDLMHYCHKHGVNFEEQLGMARRRFLEEK